MNIPRITEAQAGHATWEHSEHSGTITFPKNERDPIRIEWDTPCPPEWEEIEKQLCIVAGATRNLSPQMSQPTPAERRHYNQLVGATILRVAWEDNIPILVAELPTRKIASLYVLSDPEGNGPGFIQIEK